MYYFLMTIFGILYAYYLIIILYVLLGWIDPIRNSRFYYALGKLCEPFLRLFRGKIVIGFMDFGVTIGLILYYVILMLIQRGLM